LRRCGRQRRTATSARSCRCNRWEHPSSASPPDQPTARLASNMGHPGRSCSTAGADEGFTLTEMLVSLAILSLVAAMLLGGLKTVGLQRARLNWGSSALDEVVQAQSALRARIERMSVVTVAGASPAILDVQGTTSQLAFYAPAQDREQPIELLHYRLLL